jgi:predicted metal-dependent HD superfamily phosphohydrolase
VDFDYTPEQIDQVCRIIMATRMPQKPRTHLEEIICDADLYYLGTGDYRAIAESLYEELQHAGVYKSREEWVEEQQVFLRAHRYFSPAAIKTLFAGQQQNLLSVATNPNY